MAFAQATLVQRIRRILNDNPYTDACTEAMDTTEVGLDVADGTKYDIGAIVEFTDDGELCLVTAINSNTLTVIRNYDFSITATAGTGTTHSSGCVIRKDPTFSYKRITDAIGATMRSLWPNVYLEVSLSITPSTTGAQWYDNTGDIMWDLSSAAQASTSTPYRIQRYGERGQGYPISLHRNLPTAVVASGTGIFIPSLYNTTNAILVAGIGRINDDLDTGNYTDITAGTEVDCVTYLTVARLVAESDIARVTMEDPGMGNASTVGGRRTTIAEYWERKGIAARNSWEEELRVTLPRMPRYNQGAPASRLGRWT